MIKLHKSKNGQFYFTICGNNGHVIVTSETYKTHRNMIRGVYAFTKAAKTVVDGLHNLGDILNIKKVISE